MSKEIKTAVQILVDGLIIFGYLHSNEYGQSPKVIELINQAKEIEKEQIEDAYQAGQDNVDYTACFVDENGLENYYELTYGGNK
jgi:hypothetical protein